MDSAPNFNLTFPRFANTSGEEQDEIMKNRNAKNTNRATKSSMTMFREYLVEKQLKPVEELTADELPEIMKNFYTDARKVDGSDYCVQSMKCLRAGINRYMKAEKNLDIIENEKFVTANEMFRGVNKRKRVQGKGSTKPTPVISEADLQKINEYFLQDFMNNPNPRKLQQCLLFYIIYFFCRRGRENLYTMTP